MPLKHLVKNDTVKQGGKPDAQHYPRGEDTVLRTFVPSIDHAAICTYPQVPVTLVGSRSAARLTRSRSSSSVIGRGAGKGTTGGQLVCDLSDTGSPMSSMLDRGSDCLFIWVPAAAQPAAMLAAASKPAHADQR
jgi:hypothetical protein